MAKTVCELSVVVPVYNCEKYISRCLSSVINQDYKNIEIIVVNDGSTDSSLEICREYEKNNDNVTVINIANRGVMSARQIGVAYSSGKYISFVDADDWVEPNIYEKRMMYIDESTISVLSNYTIREKEQITNRDEAIRQLCLLKFPTSLWAYIYPKQIVEQIGFDTDIHFFEDFVFNLKAIKLAEKIQTCEGYLYHYESNPESINRKGLSEKRMSCLNIIPRIIRGGDLFVEQYEKELLFSASHFLISNLVVARIDSNKLLLAQLMDACKKYLRIISSSEYVPFTYRLVLGLGAKSIKSVCVINFLRDMLF